MTAEPYKIGLLDTGDGHHIYWEACGNPKGRPVVFLHGGPGSGCSPWQRAFFDAKKYNAVFFDQRGCGHSRPFTSLRNNTTAHLIRDMELLRAFLGIKKWDVFGGSWGSTLALAYADQHPRRVTSLILRGVFLCRPQEIRDIYFEGGVVSRIFPEAFEKFISLLPPRARKNPVKGYAALFRSKNAKLRRRAYDAWTRLESGTVKLIVTPQELKKSMSDAAWVRAFAMIENHYFLKDGFIDAGKILKNIGRKMKRVPVHIVQGRYDVVCPFKTAWELHKAIPHSRLHVIPDAGHSAKEKGILRKLTEIMNELE
jgi:proline iminopeptidase